jgi:uncharacterized membrane protein HdeD (DUF308 family)
VVAARLISGIVDLVLGGLLLIGWPGTAIWGAGLLVGINMLLAGAALLFGCPLQPVIIDGPQI